MSEAGDFCGGEGDVSGNLIQTNRSPARSQYSRHPASFFPASSPSSIAAICTSTLPAARAIIRISGDASASVVTRLTGGPAPRPGASVTAIRFGGLRVPCAVYWFASPRSYTGEDVAEFHIPGNPLLCQMLLEELFALGIRAAEPGEFTARAFFNARLSLEQAEGVAATIGAQNDRQLQGARRLLEGELARRLATPRELLSSTLALLEAGIDFSEEDVSFLGVEEARARLSAADRMLGGLLTESVRFEQISHARQIVLAGRPNAGKSTLLNALAGQARAVVSPIEGTTRDAIWAEVQLAHGTVRMIDSAGLEEDDRAMPTPAGRQETAGMAIQRQMRQQAMRAVNNADLLALVIDHRDARPPLVLPRDPDLIVYTKIDTGATVVPVEGGRVTELSTSTPGVPGVGEHDEAPALSVATRPIHPARHQIFISAHRGDGLNTLREALNRLAFGDDGESSPSLALNARHVHAIEEARQAIGRASAILLSEARDELIALEIREGLNALGQIAGEITPDEVLGKIFSSFCIGK